MNKGNILYLYETAVGLGHQRRASGIVNGLIDAGFNVVVASGSFVEAENYFDRRASLLSLPANRRVINNERFFYDETNTLVHDPNYDKEEWQRQRDAVISVYASSVLISAVIAEWWPFERHEQFTGLVKTVLNTQEKKYGSAPLLISSVRDVPKPGYHTVPGKSLKAEPLIVELINEFVDTVLIHGDPALVRLEDGFTLHQEIRKPIVYTGYVVNSEAHAQRDTRASNKVLVSCGSGDDGHYLLIHALEGLALSRSLQNHEWHFVMGPRMEQNHRETFMAAAQEVANRFPSAPTPIIHSHLPELPRELARAAFSISLAGYNTTLEVAASRIPALLLPKYAAAGQEITSMDEEQWSRLVQLNKGGMASIAHPKLALQPEAFAEAIDEAFARGPTHTPLNMDGARRSAVEVGRLITERYVRMQEEIHADFTTRIFPSPHACIPNVSFSIPRNDNIVSSDSLYGLGLE